MVEYKLFRTQKIQDFRLIPITASELCATLPTAIGCICLLYVSNNSISIFHISYFASLQRSQMDTLHCGERHRPDEKVPCFSKFPLLDHMKTCRVILICVSLHYLCKQGNLNIPPFPKEENINHGIDANMNLPDNRVQVGLCFSDEFADIHFMSLTSLIVAIGMRK